jgi:hypothetical protein
VLQKDCVTGQLLNLLKKLQKEDILKKYFLVGGTSLTLQIGHRRSDDIDLFTQEDIDKENIAEYLFTNFNGKVQIINTQNLIYQLMIDQIKVDFVKHPFNLVEKVKEEDGIRFLGKKDIAAMKLRAIENSGNRAKDFIDIFYLLKEMSLKNMFTYYRQKYNMQNIHNAKRSLGYFDDVQKQSWQEVRLIHDKLSIKAVQKTIVDAIKDYDKELLG